MPYYDSKYGDCNRVWARTDGENTMKKKQGRAGRGMMGAAERGLCQVVSALLPLYTRDANDRQFVTQTEYWHEFKARPVEQLDPRDVERRIILLKVAR